MPIVFVHGVGTRRSSKYHRLTKARGELFQEFLAPALKATGRLHIVNPFWGDKAASFGWDHACLPRRSEQLGSEASSTEVLAAEYFGQGNDAPGRLLIGVASRSLLSAIDLLWAAAAEETPPTEASALANLAVTAVAYAERHPRPIWLNRARNDNEFFTQLLDEIHATQAPTRIPAAEKFGAWNIASSRLYEGFQRLTSVPARTSTNLLVNTFRGRIHRQGAEFFGDVLAYLRQREEHGADSPIAQEIASHLAAAKQQDAQDGAPLVVIAHSMGGNIVYDLLSNLRADLSCDILITVGSQVGLFAELDLFPSVSRERAVEGKVPPLANVDRWINIFDPDDLLAFATMPIFHGSHDLQYSTGKGILKSHSFYFRRPSFHRRLAKKLEGIA
ncbi:hypothetical protein [Streptomyces sp. NBC_00366]|uniref:hypothetical protein n=1 Tax=Streptomyces sp. NBC_00366 TaxID=2975727 RepID=UPI002E26F942